jgi:Flp pilus assembly protein TadD
MQLAVLAMVAVIAFLVTRAVALSNRALSVRNADEWYQRGQRLQHEGRIDDAVGAFRRATMRERTEPTYVLALAGALAHKRDYDQARRMLMTLRESAPEDPAINLELARLSAMRQDVTEALRFYHDAFYASWPGEQADARRAVRIELIRFLLAHGQSDRAHAELLGVSVDVPDDATHHVELGELFHEAGDDRVALLHLQRALHLSPSNPAAVAALQRVGAPR